MDSSVDDKIIRQKFFSSPKSSGTLLGRLPLNKGVWAGESFRYKEEGAKTNITLIAENEKL